jgi:exopolysaccharide biosynthesis polyprenyl glycosylphosphotransferase
LTPPSTQAAPTYSPKLFTVETNRAPRRDSRWTRRRDSKAAEILTLLQLCSDLFITVTVLALGCWLFSRNAERVASPVLGFPTLVAVGTATLLGLLRHSKLYETNQILNWPATVAALIRGAGGWFIALVLVEFLFGSSLPLSGLPLVGTAGIVLLFLLASRWIFSRVLQSDGVAPRLRKRVLFIGWTKQSGKLAQALWRDRTEPIEITGYVELGAVTNGSSAAVPYLGTSDDLAQVVHDHHIDIALLTDVYMNQDRINDFAGTCEREFVQFKLVPGWFSNLRSGLQIEDMGGTRVLGISQLPLHRLSNRLVKRVMDIGGAIVGLILSAPIIGLLAGLVYVESPGPIFYRQRRVGRGGRMFDIIKIRSMRMDAEQPGQIGWSTRNDPRRLRIGGFMRRWNLDEIPQFWNVLRGEMSLVGPRPERPELIENFKYDIADYNARHFVKPGLTGWAQVNGLRGDTDLVARIVHDLFYIETWSVVFDLQTMLLTFLRNKSAC